ncbi:tRNA lysidine(34) synthetase TilS [Candidatus Thiosymbion oneisti]|uniref:tRNA lysidine(34) synthetase TilS n=1 Tax=Candidatus Thiosymbion oneisti TaxID=589554 RepID=UPI000A90D289|nr:tRNA lysidine(34) synthetase TilS [Candidatus Thiosymbion oneisti]
MSASLPELLLSRLTTLPAARKGWVAYSGGMDSSVLLHALATIRDRLPFALYALHVDHGLHRDSHRWAAHCARTCARLGVPFRTRRLDLAPARGESLEAVARQARYASMAELLGSDDLLLTAQHRDDQAETLLLALLRGSGPAGLAAMPSMAPLGRGQLVRPLLELGRAELLAYARSRKLHWLEDPSNRDLGHDRNFLRHRVLPRLAERWPACATGIARSAAHCAEAQAIIDPVARNAVLETAGQRPDTLSIERLLELALPLRKAVLRQWFRGQGRVPPDAGNLDRILTEVMTARADANPLVAWSGCEVRRYRDDLFAMAPLPPVPAPDPIHWCQGVLTLPDGLGCLEFLASDGRDLDPQDVFVHGLEIRFGVTGLFCRRAREGHRRSLKKLFQELGVPPWVRPYIPLILTQGDLVAVGNLWICYPKDAAWEQEFRIRWKVKDLRLSLGP